MDCTGQMQRLAGLEELTKGQDEFKHKLGQSMSTYVVDVTSIASGTGSSVCKAVYELFREHGDIIPWSGVIWSGAQCKMWAFIIWLAEKDRLPTRKRLHNWGRCDSPRSISFHA